MSPALRPLAPTLLAASLLACVSQPSREARESGSSTPDRRVTRPKPSCAPLPADTLLVLEQTGCPIVLTRAVPTAADPSAPTDPSAPADPSAPVEPPAIELALVRIANKDEPAAEPLARGPAPLACGAALQRCEFEGIVDPTQGPLVLALERGHESEHPVQVWLGIHEGGRLGFVPSWQGESSLVDHTRIGPPFALAPFACAGELRLLPHARLPEAEGELPPGALMMLAGHWVVAELGVMPPQQPSPSAEGCTLLLAVP